MKFPRAACLMLLAMTRVAAFTSPSARKIRLSRIFESENIEPDLFEYFDPLLSPHNYPNGISPDNKPQPSFKTETMGSIGPTDFMSIMSAVKKTTSEAPPQPDRATPEVFDPLLSPHMYPNGTPDAIVGDEPLMQSSSPPSKSDAPNVFDPLLSPHVYADGASDTVAGEDPPSVKKENTNQMPQDEKTPIAPLETSAFVSLLSSVSASSLDSSPPPPLVVDPDYFDPLLSPHSYPNGTPDRFFDDAPAAKRKLGILLMDHGSRNKASNDRLHEVARAYQESCNNDEDSTVIVTAAHMEIAQPDIPTGLRTLLDEGAEEIVCHPYFLSAGGRHVSEDIPAILKEARETLKMDERNVPLVLTPPVGSETDLMILAIQKLVQDAKQPTTEQ